jgi:hypothetical protein
MRVSPSADMAKPTAQMSSRPRALRTAGGDVVEREPSLLEQVTPDVDMIGPEPHRQRVEGAAAGGRVEQSGRAERVRIEQARKRPDLVREVDQPVLVGPLADRSWSAPTG